MSLFFRMGRLVKAEGREPRFRLGRGGWAGPRFPAQVGVRLRWFREDKLGEMDTNQNTGSVAEGPRGGLLGPLFSL